jgi:hypothetical protein
MEKEEFTPPGPELIRPWGVGLREGLAFKGRYLRLLYEVGNIFKGVPYAP